MTREEARKAAEVMLAYANGEEIETLNSGEYIPCSIPGFNWAVKGVETYRIKPKPTYRPFKDRDECWNEMHKHPDFGWISDGYYKSTISVKSKSIVMTISSDEYSFTTAFQTLTFADGTPFGIKEE